MTGLSLALFDSWTRRQPSPWYQSKAGEREQENEKLRDVSDVRRREEERWWEREASLCVRLWLWLLLWHTHATHTHTHRHRHRQASHTQGVRSDGSREEGQQHESHPRDARHERRRREEEGEEGEEEPREARAEEREMRGELEKRLLAPASHTLTPSLVRNKICLVDAFVRQILITFIPATVLLP